MPGVLVDGQSALDIFEVGKEAVARARAGEGPTLIEAQTYRYQGHFGADDPLGYRTQEEEDYYEARDCIMMLKAHITDGGYATEGDIDAIDARALAAVVAAATFANESPFPDPSELTTDVYVSY
jgi:pyruvate dehydrogenase E1 component alpha subunit